MTAPPARSLGHKTTQGVAFMSAQTLVTKVISSLSQLVLAKLLLPESFGLIAMAFAIQAYASAVQEVGIREVLIREQHLLHRWANAGTWLITILGVLSALLMAAAAWPVSHALGQPEIIGLTLVLTLAQPALAIALIPQAYLERDMRFRRVALIESIATFAQVIVSILFAYLGFEAYSFALGALARAWVRLAWMLKCAMPRLRPTPQLHRWPRFLRAGLPTTGAALLEKTLQQSDYIVLSILTKDPSLVGQYFFAFNQSTVIAQIFVQSVIRVLLSGLSALKNNIRRQADAFLEAIGMLGLLTVPLGVLQASIARPFMTLIFGDRWAAAIPMLEILSIITGMAVIAWPSISLLMAQGRYTTRFFLRLWGTIGFVTSVGLVGFIGKTYGAPALGVALGVTLFRIVYGPLTVWVACKPARIGFRRILPIFFSPLAGALLAIIPTTLATRWALDAAGLEGNLAHIAHILISPGPGLVLYWLWCKLVQPKQLAAVRPQLERVLPARILRRVPAWLL